MIPFILIIDASLISLVAAYWPDKRRQPQGTGDMGQVKGSQGKGINKEEEKNNNKRRKEKMKERTK